MRAWVIGVALAVTAAGGLSACGGSSSTTSHSRRSTGGAASPAGSSPSGSSSKPSAQPGGLSNALLRSGSAHPSAVVCLAERTSERARSPFGPGGAPVYACTLTVSGAHIAYDVQLLHNGCFVAERRRPGKAIYGCGAGRP